MSDKALKRMELRRGWPIILIGLLGTATSVVALPFYILGPLTPMLESEFGWQRTSIVEAAAFLQMGFVLGMPIAGKLIDRFGARGPALASYAALVSIMCLIALRLDSLLMLGAAYFAIGLICSGAGTIAYTLLIGKWFHRARGVALGFCLAGTGIASFLAPILVEAVGSAMGWRAALLVVAGILALGIPIILLGYREPPFEIEVTTPTHSKTPQVDWRDMFAEPRFLLLAFILAVGGFFISSMIVHFMPMLIEKGFSSATAARTVSLMGIALIVGRLVIGYLLDHAPAVWLGTAMFLIAAGGCLIFVVGGPAFAPAMIIAMGFMIGAEIDLLSYLTLRYFRVSDYGVIYGYLYGIYMAGCILSPWVTSYFLGLGGYDAMFIAAAATFTFIAMLFPVLEKLPTGPASKTGIVARAAVAPHGT